MQGVSKIYIRKYGKDCYKHILKISIQETKINIVGMKVRVQLIGKSKFNHLNTYGLVRKMERNCNECIFQACKKAK